MLDKILQVAEKMNKKSCVSLSKLQFIFQLSKLDKIYLSQPNQPIHWLKLFCLSRLGLFFVWFMLFILYPMMESTLLSYAKAFDMPQRDAIELWVRYAGELPYWTVPPVIVFSLFIVVLYYPRQLSTQEVQEYELEKEVEMLKAAGKKITWKNIINQLN